LVRLGRLQLLLLLLVVLPVPWRREWWLCVN